MTKEPDPKYLAWVDIETSGLSMQHDYIVEFALIVTDIENLDRLIGPYSTVVQHGPLEVILRRIEDEPIVHKMHTDNGLIDQLQANHGKSLRRVEIEACELLGTVGEPSEFLIAGSGVAQFDQPWLRNYMPSLDRFFRYSPYDVGSVRRFIKYTLKRPDLLLNEIEIHRAGPDVEHALAECRLYQQIFKDVVRPGSDEEM